MSRSKTGRWHVGKREQAARDGLVFVAAPGAASGNRQQRRWAERKLGGIVKAAKPG